VQLGISVKTHILFRDPKLKNALPDISVELAQQIRLLVQTRTKMNQDNLLVKHVLPDSTVLMMEAA
jgi:hypothetical protein